jgi:hypothetical protein
MTKKSNPDCAFHGTLANKFFTIEPGKVYTGVPSGPFVFQVTSNTNYNYDAFLEGLKKRTNKITYNYTLPNSLKKEVKYIEDQEIHAGGEA